MQNVMIVCRVGTDFVHYCMTLVTGVNFQILVFCLSVFFVFVVEPCPTHLDSRVKASWALAPRPPLCKINAAGSERAELQIDVLIRLASCVDHSSFSQAVLTTCSAS